MSNAHRVAGANQRTEYRFADGLLEIGWLLLAILTPLFINLSGKHPFELPKAAILRTVVWAMVGVWLIDVLLSRVSLWRELRDNPLLFPATAVAVVQILATVAGVDRGLSLWGGSERAQGALTTVSYVLLFFVVAARLRDRDQARRLFAAIAVTAVLLIGLSLAQILDRDPVGLISDARSPVYATLGRSNFVGAYLAMVLPVTLSLILMARGKWMQLAGALLMVGQLVVIALTLSRGAWLAAVSALCAFGLLWNWRRLNRGWRAALTIVAGVALVTVLGGTLWIGRAAGSTAARLTIWRATVGLIAKRPVLGYGPDALELVFPRVYPPQLVYYQGRGATVDRAHNLLLDAAATTGLLGLVAGMTLLALFLVLGWRALRSATGIEHKTLLIVCLAAVIGNTVGNLVSFDVTATATLTALLMAVTVALAKTHPAEPAHSAVSQRSVRRWLAASAVLACVGCLAIALNFRPLAADVAIRVSEMRAAGGDWDGAINAAERAVAYQPAQPENRLSLSWALLQRAQQEANAPLPWLKRAEGQLLAALELRPRDHRIWAALGELYGVWANRWDAGQLPLAHESYRRATELAPYNATLYVAWGMVDLDAGRFAPAAERFRKAVDLDATDGHAFLHLGNAEYGLANVASALNAYGRAVRWIPDSSQALLGVARCSWQLGQRDEADAALKRAQQLDPGAEVAWRHWLQSLP